MPSSFVFRHDGLILDACCLINLHASKHMADILKSIPSSTHVAAYVYEEEIIRFDLKPFIDAGLLAIVTIDSEAEEEFYVNYAAAIRDDGEAVTGAIGVNRGWAIATDDRRATNVLIEDAPDIQIVTTLELMKHWIDSNDVSRDVARRSLESVRVEGRYAPVANHVLFAWWKSQQEHE